MELIDIVNDNNEYIGEVLEREEVYKQNKYHRLISVFILNSSNEILIQKRSKNKEKNPNKYSILNGHVISGEDTKCAAIREIKEEIGIDVNENELELFEVYKSESNTNYFRYIYILNKNIDISDMKLDLSEVSEVRYVSIEEFKLIVKDENLSNLCNKSYINGLIDKLKGCD